jgi:hypothetical protein
MPAERPRDLLILAGGPTSRGGPGAAGRDRAKLRWHRPSVGPTWWGSPSWRWSSGTSCPSSSRFEAGITPSIGALLAHDAWALLVLAVVFGLAYVTSGRRLVPSGLVAYALAPVVGRALRRPRVELAVLAALAVGALAAHRGHIRRALGLGAAMS